MYTHLLPSTRLQEAEEQGKPQVEAQRVCETGQQRLSQVPITRKRRRAQLWDNEVLFLRLELC